MKIVDIKISRYCDKIHGIEIKEAERLKHQIDSKISSLNNDILKYQAKIDNGGLSDKKTAKLERKISDAQDRISNLNTSRADIDRLGEDQNNTYALNHISGGEHHVKQGNDGKVYIETSSDALSLHEISHVRQSLDAGGLKFEKGKSLNAYYNGTPKEFSNMEIEAYQIQYSYDMSFPGKTSNLRGIDVHSVGNIWNSEKKAYQYQRIKNYSDYLKKAYKKFGKP
ncbi:MAG: hypothetical protein LBE13_03495 [Bacteroidales bacterium]|jgi:hypothetical protein|nr:hypothetical protein [Bacteroidales bacterium]